MTITKFNPIKKSPEQHCYSHVGKVNVFKKQKQTLSEPPPSAVDFQESLLAKLDWPVEPLAQTNERWVNFGNFSF